jgi:hypothetical protein
VGPGDEGPGAPAEARARDAGRLALGRHASDRRRREAAPRRERGGDALGDEDVVGVRGLPPALRA